MLLDPSQIFLSQKLAVLGGNVAALGRQRIDKALPLQLLVGALGRNKADTQILGKSADGGQQLMLGKLPTDDLIFNLSVDL